jgi:hypothetical protein
MRCPKVLAWFGRERLSMLKTPHVPASSAEQYLTRRRVWLFAAALLWLLGLSMLVSSGSRDKVGGDGGGGAGVPGVMAAHASSVPTLHAVSPSLAQAVSSSGREMSASVATAGMQQLVEREKAVHDFAVKSFREGRYATAFGRFVELADGGDKASAEVALFMLRHGSELFGSAWSASEEEQLLWHALVAGSARTLIENPGGE